MNHIRRKKKAIEITYKDFRRLQFNTGTGIYRRVGNTVFLDMFITIKREEISGLPFPPLEAK